MQTKNTAAESTLTPADLDSIIERYVAVWSEPDPDARRRAVEGLWAGDGVEFVENVQFRGHEALDARVTEAYQAFVQSGKFAVTRADDATFRRDAATFTIQLLPADSGWPGEPAWAARVVLLLAEDGLIQEDYHVTVLPLAG